MTLEWKIQGKSHCNAYDRVPSSEWILHNIFLLVGMFNIRPQYSYTGILPFDLRSSITMYDAHKVFKSRVLLGTKGTSKSLVISLKFKWNLHAIKTLCSAKTLLQVFTYLILAGPYPTCKSQNYRRRLLNLAVS